MMVSAFMFPMSEVLRNWRPALVAFAKGEFTDELVRFHKDVGDLSRKYQELIPINDATNICNRYIVEGGEDQINLR